MKQRKGSKFSNLDPKSKFNSLANANESENEILGYFSDYLSKNAYLKVLIVYGFRTKTKTSKVIYDHSNLLAAFVNFELYRHGIKADLVDINNYNDEALREIACEYDYLISLANYNYQSNRLTGKLFKKDNFNSFTWIEETLIKNPLLKVFITEYHNKQKAEEFFKEKNEIQALLFYDLSKSEKDNINAELITKENVLKIIDCIVDEVAYTIAREVLTWK
ncbi:hypothetical protein CJJ23_04520 [Mycoplasmopsis agassizii]|uniref:Uncharacterized protein n=1 Tax=Mycoplasmopsis agassizii TaxID=33922 RepID=A0A269THV8_9BACT|nr:hypothetical protein [Mycoplasmopsis agassizii]PAK20977.1 hypothetical protein CJJ23_04520 [Mycoplasmopsis agassizii]